MFKGENPPRLVSWCQSCWWILLEYTLNKPETFWNSKTTNGILFPISTEFLKSKGDIWSTKRCEINPYHGPFLLKSITSNHLLYLKRTTIARIRKTFTLRSETLAMDEAEFIGVWLLWWELIQLLVCSLQVQTLQLFRKATKTISTTHYQLVQV